MIMIRTPKTNNFIFQPYLQKKLNDSKQHIFTTIKIWERKTTLRHKNLVSLTAYLLSDHFLTLNFLMDIIHIFTSKSKLQQLHF